jgi:hypothetical protein
METTKMHIKVLSSLLFFLLSLSAFSQPLQMPAKQVSAVDGNNTSEYLTVSGSTAQLVIDNLELVTTNLYTLSDFPDIDTDNTDDLTNVVINAKSLDGALTFSNQNLYVSFPQNVTNTVVGTNTPSGALTLSAGGLLTVKFPTTIDSDASALTGYISGLVPEYKDANEVTVSPGIAVVGDSLVTLTNSTDVTVTVASPRDFHYIYLATNGAFSASITEPTEQTDGTGWYNGALRCIGSVRSTDGASTIVPYHTATDAGGSYELFLNKDDSGEVLAYFYNAVTAAELWKPPNANSFTLISQALPVHSNWCWLDYNGEWTDGRYDPAVDPLYGSAFGTGLSGAVDEGGTGTGSVFFVQAMTDHHNAHFGLPLSLGNTKSLSIGISATANVGRSTYVMGWRVVR